MAQRFIEVVIGRLLTDEAFRAGFLDDPDQALARLVNQGLDLTRAEITALLATDSELWNQIADRVEPGCRRPTSETESRS